MPEQRLVDAYKTDLLRMYEQHHVTLDHKDCEEIRGIITDLERDNASLTAEVERLREGIDYALTAGTYGVMEGRLRALTPPALATRSPLGKPFNPGIVIDNTPRLIQPPKIGEGSLPKPAPEDNRWKPCPDCKGKTACDCHLCWGRGRVPAPEDDNAVSGEGGG